MCAVLPTPGISKRSASRPKMSSVQRSMRQTPSAKPWPNRLKRWTISCAGWQMSVAFGPFAAVDLARVTQLINKTNQFNPTTRRYTYEEVASIAAAPENITLAVPTARQVWR